MVQTAAPVTIGAFEMNFNLTQLEPFGALVEAKGEITSVKNLDLNHLRDLFTKNHLLVLRGFNTFKTSKDFADYCETWGEVSVWPFGKVLELIEQEYPKDHIFDSSYVPMHWDGMYRPQVPEYQIFHCVTAPLPGHGGRTTFSNTVLALANAPLEAVKMWSSVTATYKRKVEFYDSKTVSPIVTKHPFRGFSVIRYNEVHSHENGHLINPVEHEFSGIDPENVEKFHRDLRKALYSPHCLYAHQWQHGDVVITDNFTLLHGREAFTSKSPRHIQRVQVLSNPPLKNPGLEFYQ
jgi:alpha-ketoglutarate-dependent taurine dioxygenase